MAHYETGPYNIVAHYKTGPYNTVAHYDTGPYNTVARASKLPSPPRNGCRASASARASGDSTGGSGAPGIERC